MHFPEWMPEQSFAVALNGGTPWQSPIQEFDAASFWRLISVPLEIEDQKPGKNFISITFDRLYVPPDTDTWRSSGRIQSIHVTEPGPTP
jgi:hypothetical protein